MSFDGIKRAALERITAGSEGARLIGSQLTGVTGSNIQVLLEALLARVLPLGGTTGQALTKSSNTDYAVSWSTIAGGGGDMLATLQNAEVSLTGVATLTSTAFGKMHVCSGASNFTVNLPAVSGNTGKIIGVRVSSTATLTAVTVDPNASELIDGVATKTLQPGDSAILYCTGTVWSTFAARRVPASGDYSAGQITNTPAGNVAATTVQAALNELDTEKATPAQIPVVSSQAQADTGTDDATFMSPLKVASRPQKNVVFESFITGLTLVWASPGSNFNNLTVTPGAAWVPSLGKILNAPSTLTATAGTPSASTWYYVYLYDNSGTPALDVSTTAPAAPYKGAARAKTSDTSRRFLAAARTDGSGVFYNFIMQGDLVKYRLITNAAPFRALNGGTSTTATAVACNTVIPPVSQIASIRITNGANVNMQVDNTDATGTGSGANGMIVIAAGVNMVTDFPLNTSQELRYWMLSAVGSGSGFVDVYGYVNAR